MTTNEIPDITAIERLGREHPLPENQARSLYAKILGITRHMSEDDSVVLAEVDRIIAQQYADGLVRPEEEDPQS